MNIVDLQEASMDDKRFNKQNLRVQVEKEIQEHGVSWCTTRCSTFLPETYRLHRLEHGMSEALLKEDYDSCHMFR